jgi:hypothetical protein
MTMFRRNGGDEIGGGAVQVAAAAVIAASAGRWRRSRCQAVGAGSAAGSAARAGIVILPPTMAALRRKYP